MTTFHELVKTLMTHADDILKTLKTHGEDSLTVPRNSGEDTLMTPVMTRDYLVTTPHDVIDNPCDDIDGLEQIAMVGAIPGDNKDNKLMTMTTNNPK